ncbi:MAG: hypothetical protein K2G32_11010 [Oscillospiraceae bacterium]|nr:hypothetical protein [Oscillospiraceae bacterium]
MDIILTAGLNVLTFSVAKLKPGSLSSDELNPPMRATPTVTRLSDGKYAYTADL